MKKYKRRRSGEEKSIILRRHLADKIAVSDLCEEYGIQPSVFYSWQKQMFDNLGVVFDSPKQGKRAAAKEKNLVHEIAKLENKLATKENVIAEISEEYVALKKALGEP